MISACVGDWIVINHYGDVWTAKISEISGECIKPDVEIHVNPKWYHRSSIRKATSEEISAEENNRRKE